MTTPTIDDELGCLVGRIAAAQGKTVDDFVAAALRQALATPPSIRRVVRDGIPVMLVPNEVARIDPDKVRGILEEEGF